MPGRITAHVFIDANTALHFKRPDQIDWRRLTNTGEVRLVAAPILLRELESQKIVNTSQRLRERANAYIKWLHPFVVDSAMEVRSRVRWVLLPHEPQIDFAAERLSPGIADDHLIGSVLDYAPAPNSLIFVATADIGLDIKLRARGIKILALPAEARLPAEPDPLERENKTLRQEITRLQARIPKLSVTFQDANQHLALHLSHPRRVGVLSLSQIKAERPPMVGPGEASPSQGGVASPFAGLHRQLQDRVVSRGVDTYNRQLVTYYDEYEQYVADMEAWQEKICLHAMIELVLANDGTAPATNIDLELSFPEKVTPVDTGDFPEEPIPPKPPARPRGIVDICEFTDTDYVSSLLRQPDLSAMINPNYDGVPIIDKETSSLRISVSSLKHGFSSKCDPFPIRFRSRQSISAFSIEYRLSADELPNAVIGELHVRIDDGGT